VAETLVALWGRHQQEALPEVPALNKGELWVLDEVIGGCISYYLDAGRTLDMQRLAILRDCRADLDRLLPELEGPALDYFLRLGTLAELVLSADATEHKSLEASDDMRPEVP
jgi:hypothetical protein